MIKNKSIVLFRKTIFHLKPMLFPSGTHTFRGMLLGKDCCASNPAGNFPCLWRSRKKQNQYKWKCIFLHCYYLHFCHMQGWLYLLTFFCRLSTSEIRAKENIFYRIFIPLLISVSIHVLSILVLNNEK